MAHWARIRQRLADGNAEPVDSSSAEPSWVDLVPVGIHSLHQALGEIPYLTWQYEQYRTSITLDDHDPILALKSLLLDARKLYEKLGDSPLERATPSALAKTLDYVRRLTLSGNRLTPDLYTLIVAAKGIVGNDFALAILEVASAFPPNHAFVEPDPDEGPTWLDELQKKLADFGFDGSSSGTFGEGDQTTPGFLEVDGSTSPATKAASTAESPG